MKKWKIAQRKMAWQVKGVTGDRNIGGHTARIPDAFQFIDGNGPRGIGIDFPDKELINKLAEAIIPQKTMSRKDRICAELEERWMEHHGNSRSNSRKTSSTSALEKNSHVNLQECGPTEGTNFGTFLDRSPVKEPTLRKMIGQMSNNSLSTEPKPAPKKLFKTMSTGKLINNNKTDSRSKLNNSDSRSKLLKRSDSRSKLLIKADSRTDLSSVKLKKTNSKAKLTRKASKENVRPSPLKTMTPQTTRPNLKLPTSNPRTNLKMSRSNSSTDMDGTQIVRNTKTPENGQKADLIKRGSSRKLTQSLINAPSKRPHKSAAKHEKPVMSPDSGFSSDKSNSKSSNVFQIPPKPNTAPTKAMLKEADRAVTISDFFGNQGSSLLLKTRSEGDIPQKPQQDKNANDLSAVPENALLWLQQKGKNRTSFDLLNRKSKIKRAYHATELVSTLTRNKGIMPLNETYSTPSNKDGYQTFTRRRTKGMMYDTLEPVSYSEFYRLRSPGAPCTVAFRSPATQVSTVFRTSSAIPANLHNTMMLSTLSKLKSVTGAFA